MIPTNKCGFFPIFCKQMLDRKPGLIKSLLNMLKWLSEQGGSVALKQGYSVWLV